MNQSAASLCLLASLAGATCVFAQENELGIEALIERYPELQTAQIEPSPIEGFYEINVGGTISYLSTDGEFQIRGDIFKLDTRQNLTEASRASYRATLLATLDPRDEIVFSPASGAAKYKVTVFTDVDCGYCRQLHSEIDAINDLGIEVRYVSFPRSGPNTESWARAEHVWCSADRHAALTQSKLGAEVEPEPGCSTTPVAAQFDLGMRLAMSGTPAIYSETGVELGGYLPPADLLAALERLGQTP